MIQSGYANTPLAKKLGIKPGFKIKLVNPPVYYHSLFSHMPENVFFLHDKMEKKHLIHYFATQLATFQTDLLLLKNEIAQNGVIWISWPKKASRVKTDITEDLIRNFALANGLVDVKVCAVNETWSGLKLMIPVKKPRYFIAGL